MDGNQNPNNNNNNNPNNNPNPNPNNPPGGVNWTDELVEKLSKVWDGSANPKGRTAVSSYLKQKGLASEEELDSIVNEFIQKRKASEPDVNSILATNKAQAAEIAQYRLRDAASDLADELGFDVKNIKRMLKAGAEDLKDVVKEDGTIDNEKLKTALTTLLTDIPEFKKSATKNGGFQGDKPDFGGKKSDAGNQAPAKSTRPKNSRDLLGDILGS